MTAMLIRRISVRGRVQGVGFRDFVARAADRQGMEGWVRNRTDGSVEAVFSGAPETVAAMIEICRKGPPSSRVDALDEAPARMEDLTLRRIGERFSFLATV